MNGSRLDAIRRDLETEYEIAEAEVGRLKAELSAAEKDHKAIKDALAALGRKPGQTPKKPVFKKVEVVKAITSLLTRAGRPMSREELETALRQYATKSGKSLNGLQLRIKEALSADEFTESEAGFAPAAASVVG